MDDENDKLAPGIWSERFNSMESKLNQIYTDLTGDSKMGHAGIVDQLRMVQERERERERERKLREHKEEIKKELRQYKELIEQRDAETREMVRKQENRFIRISSIVGGLGTVAGFVTAIASGAVSKVEGLFESFQAIMFFLQ